MKNFSLNPFPGLLSPCRTAVEGSISRQSTALSIRFSLRGRLEEFAISTPADKPARTMRLWEETCFEFFLAPMNSIGYWEFNLSPAGHWNVYRFLDYRKGMTEEKIFTSLPFRVEERPDSLSIILEFDTAEIISQDQPIAVSINTVLKRTDGEKTFWALTHTGSRPDFHRRDSFILML
jgi:hypothetical protein